MQIIKYSEASLHLAVEYLRKGLLISFPTETVYALACDPSNHRSIKRIAEIKRRSNLQVFSLLAPNIEMVRQYAHVDKQAEKLIQHFSPGPITYVLHNRVLAKLAPGSEMQGATERRNASVLNIHADPSTGATQQIAPGVEFCKNSNKKSERISSELIKDGKIGIRIPNHKIALDILNEYKRPIVASSVNLTGEPSARSVDEMSDTIKSQIDLIIDGGQCDIGVSSTVIDIASTQPILIREGSITFTHILRALA